MIRFSKMLLAVSPQALQKISFHFLFPMPRAMLEIYPFGHVPMYPDSWSRKCPLLGYCGFGGAAEAAAVVADVGGGKSGGYRALGNQIPSEADFFCEATCLIYFLCRL